MTARERIIFSLQSYLVPFRITGSRPFLLSLHSYITGKVPEVLARALEKQLYICTKFHTLMCGGPIFPFNGVTALAIPGI